jgi:NAD(P)-dependent dehydrogenase (short-subunit alcohol dehydrogenase family)
MSEQRQLEGQVAIVTGAGSKSSGLGTGKAIAVLLAREGARVVLVDRHDDRAAETLHWIEREGGTATIVNVDLTDPSSCQTVLDAALDQFGRIDVLVNNAAVIPGTDVVGTSLEDLQEAIAVNLVAPFLLSKGVVPAMVEVGGGSIVFITSVLAIRGPSPPAYAATKAAMTGLALSIANSHGKQGIRANCVAPGMIDTPMRSASITRSGIDPATVDATKHTSLGDGGDAWDVAHTTLFLVGPAGRYLTGLHLPVDGGSTTRLI